MSCLERRPQFRSILIERGSTLCVYTYFFISCRQCLTMSPSQHRVVLCTHFSQLLHHSSPPHHPHHPPTITSSHGHGRCETGLCQIRSPHKFPTSHIPTLTKSPTQVNVCTCGVCVCVCVLFGHVCYSLEWFQRGCSLHHKTLHTLPQSTLLTPSLSPSIPTPPKINPKVIYRRTTTIVRHTQLKECPVCPPLLVVAECVLVCWMQWRGRCEDC